MTIRGSILELIPQFIIGGLLLFVAADFLIEWLSGLTAADDGPDYALMWGIVVIVAAVGFLPGRGCWLSGGDRTLRRSLQPDRCRETLLTAKDHQSNIERSGTDAKYLQEVGDSC